MDATCGAMCASFASSVGRRARTIPACLDDSVRRNP
jgi:hypothetical protein